MGYPAMDPSGVRMASRVIYRRRLGRGYLAKRDVIRSDRRRVARSLFVPHPLTPEIIKGS